MSRGKYIVLEGAEGVGKSTQLQELARRLQAAGLPVRTLREPDSQSDLTARAIRQLTQDPRYPMNTRAEVLLYNAARAQSLQVIKQSVEQGVICLVDRNYLTTLAIQYYGRGDVPDYQAINTIINFAVGGIEPDLCVVLDAPVNVLMERLKNRNSGERYDNLSDAFLERVRAGYLWEAKQRGFPVVFATDEPSKVADNIWKLVSKELAIREQAAANVAPPASVKEIIEQKQIPAQKPAESNRTTEEKDSPAALGAVSSLVAAKLESYKFDVSFEQQLDKRSYYTPDYLKRDVKKQYEQAINNILDKHTEIQKKLIEHLQSKSNVPEKRRNDAWKATIQKQAREAADSVLPVATTCAVSIGKPSREYKDTIVRLMSDELPEARQTAKNLLNKSLLKDIGDPKEYEAAAAGVAESAKRLKQASKKYLPEPHAAVTDGVNLVDFWPKNELLLVADILYEYSNLPLEQLQSVTNSWSYEQKMDIFKSYVSRENPKQLPGKALEKVHYSWDLVSDFAAFINFQAKLIGEDLNWQLLTPRYGYEVPALMEEAGLTDEFEACFDISLKLYSHLQQAGYPLEAQYATLRGHKMRWKVTYNARETLRLRLDAGELTIKMHEKLAEVHPLLAEASESSGSKSVSNTAGRHNRAKSTKF